MLKTVLSLNETNLRDSAKALAQETLMIFSLEPRPDRIADE